MVWTIVLITLEDIGIVRAIVTVQKSVHVSTPH